MSSIWKKWLDTFEWTFEFNFTKDRTPEQLDKETKEFLDVELQTAIDEIAKLNRLRKTPQLFRQRWETIKAADAFRTTFHSALNRLQKYCGEFLTSEEKADRDRWLTNCTPRKDCKHLKGPMASRWGIDTYGGPSAARHYEDYNLAEHTFIDGRAKIWCLWNCGFVVWSDGNKEEFLKAQNMLRNSSTNRPSASERFMASKDGKSYIVVCGDKIPEANSDDRT